MIPVPFMKTKTELKETVRNTQNRTETGQQIGSLPVKKRTKLPKTHQDHWFSKLKKRSYLTPDGKTEIEIPTWQVRLFHAGKEGWFNLGTANQAAAAVKARDIYVFLKANGWDAALLKFKPDSNVAPRLNLTVGDYLAAVKVTGYLRLRTFLNYQTGLRTIVSEAFGVKSDDSKYDYRHGGNKKWGERVDGIRLERVTPARVIEWQQRRVKQAGNSPVALASAKRTANSYVRCARSLFAKDILKRVKGVQLPAKLPFDGVELFESGNTKYVSKVDVHALIAAARNELKPNEPETYKVFLLGLFAGMRRGEIDLAEWRMVDWRNGVIKLEETDWLHLKTHDSAGEITIDPEVIAELRQFMPASKSPFIVTSVVTWGNGEKKRTRTRLPRNDSARAYYRCEPIFDRLNEWLRSKGVKANKPLHEMRKEIGALIATEHGIYAASRFLRHSDITTTARHYADHKARISVGLGKLLDTEIKPADQEARR
jgi:integrase